MRTRVAPDEPALGREAEQELRPAAQRAPAPYLCQGSIPAALEVGPPEIPGALEDTAVLRQFEDLQGAAGGERQADPGVALDGRPDGGQHAVLALETRDQAGRVVGAGLEGIRREQPGITGPEDRDSQLDGSASRRDLAEIRHRVPKATVVQGQGSGEQSSADRGIGIRDLEVVDVLSKLPLEGNPLAPAEEIRVLQPDEPAEAGPL